MSLALETRPIAGLIRYSKNSRTHSEGQIEQLAASMLAFGFPSPILIRGETGEIVAGHGRLSAAELLVSRGHSEFAEVPVLIRHGWSEAQFRAYVIADNKLAEEAGWDEDLLRLELGEIRDADFDIDVTGFDDAWLDGITDPPAEAPKNKSLAERFGVVPFSVLNAREGWWQDRKRAWLALGIASEVGRGENLLKMSDTMLEPDAEKRAKNKAKASAMGTKAMAGQGKGMTAQAIGALPGEQTASLKGGLTHGTTTDPYRKPGEGAPSNQSGTSIFDPVLCELAYRWFSPAGGVILDPFAGGSVRGIVAAKLGRRYFGQDLRAEQVEANIAQGAKICPEHPPHWTTGDSRFIAEGAGLHLPEEGADFLFSCPPYADLEVYSDDPADISTLGYPEFVAAYREIIAAACALLRNDAFACFVVGEVRDSKGAYLGFVPDTIEAFRAAGLEFYNEAILVTSAGSLPMRTAKQFEASRKFGKTHQNVLVFVKGSAKRATERIGSVEFGVMESEPEAQGEAEQRPGGELDDSAFGEPL